MSISRRTFSGNALALAFASALMNPEARASAGQASSDEAPHDAYGFWNGFFDSVNVAGPGYHPGARAGSTGLANPEVETQYLHYKEDDKLLRYANNITHDELLDHEGDVALSIQLSQFVPANRTGESDNQQQQWRIDATQTHPYMNILSPLAWTAIASIKPTLGNKMPSLETLGFKSDQALSATKNILLTQGTGKLAVNVSRPPNDSQFLKVLKVMISGARMAAPLLVLPAVSVPAMSAFSEAFGYWEDRTRFVMNGNLTTAVATQQAFKDPERSATYLGLLNGDYVMVGKKDTTQLSNEIKNLQMNGGYLVSKDADPGKLPQAQALEVLQGVAYTTMKLSLKPVDGSCPGTRTDASDGGGEQGGGGGGGEKPPKKKKP